MATGFDILLMWDAMVERRLVRYIECVQSRKDFRYRYGPCFHMMKGRLYNLYADDRTWRDGVMLGVFWRWSRCSRSSALVSCVCRRATRGRDGEKGHENPLEKTTKEDVSGCAKSGSNVRKVGLGARI